MLLNGDQNQLFLSGERQDGVHLPCIKLGKPGLIANVPVSPGKIVIPITPEGVVPFLVPYQNINGGLSALLNLEPDSQVVITGFEIVATETTTGTGGLNIGYEDAPNALATIADITLAAGTVVLWSDATKVLLQSGWLRAIPQGKAFTVAATGALTAGTLAVVIRYAIVPTNPNP